MTSSPMHRPGPRSTRGSLVVVAGAALLALATLTACGSAGESASTAGAAAGATPQNGAASVEAAPVAGGASSAQKDAAGAAAGQAAVRPRLVRTAEITVQVDNLGGAAALVRAAALSLGGTVASETTSFAPVTPPVVSSPTAADSGATPSPAPTAQPGESVIVVRVPEPSLDQAVDKVARVGKELGRTSSSQDVTADLADLESRVKTQQASVDRVRALLAKATDLQQVVLLESELAKRESDLEAFEARRASLADRADLATLTVDLRTPAVGPAPSTEPDQGFLAGLRSGWNAVISSTRVVLTVLGALLPWAVVAMVFGWPTLLVLRRRAARRPAPATPAGPAGGYGGAGPWGPPGRPGPGGQSGPGGQGGSAGPDAGGAQGGPAPSDPVPVGAGTAPPS